MDDLFFYYLAGVPLLGIVAQWLAWRLRLPSILLLLLFGVLLGQLFTSPDDLLAELAGVPEDTSLGAKILFPLVSLSVAVILFEGGLSLRIGELRTAGQGVFRLVSLGALLSWIMTALVASRLWPDLGMRLSALLGAVLIVTGPTVVVPLLRHIRPVRRVASIVKWEGIVIDPIGAVLAVLVFEEILAHGAAASFLDMSLILIKTAAIGAVISAVAALVLIELIKRYWIPDYLHGVVFLATALGSFAVANLIQEESGLVTVTVLGVILANQKTIPVHHVVQFKEHLGVLLISCLFIVLGSRLDPAEFVELGWRGVAFVAALILVVRPLSVFLCTLGSDLSWREKVFFACLAPRGIVAAAVISVFALKVASTPSMGFLAGGAPLLVPVTFLVIVGTVAVYGLAAAPIAKALGLSDTNAQGILFGGAAPWLRKIALLLQEEDLSVLLIDTNYSNVAAAKMAGLPAECASILSEYVQEEVDLGGIGRMLAVTPSDEVNTLAVREFVHVFGRANVYQLPHWDEGSTRRASVAERLRGRLLFQKQLHHDELERRIEQGVQIVKKTRLSEEFTVDDFVERYGASAVILFVIDEAKKLRICTADDPVEPQPGQTVIALVEPVAETDEEATDA